MKSKCILINPWIYDFSALNLWARPLGLLRVAEYVSRYGLSLSLIDCTDIYRTKRRFGTGKYPRLIIEKPPVLKAVPRNYARYGISVDEFRKKLKNLLPCDFVLVSSIMAYWYPGVQQVIEIVKSMSPDTPLILGGIYATLFSGHAAENSGADHIFAGQISEEFERVLETFGQRLIKKTGTIPYYHLDLYGSIPFAPLLTSTGCPYRCSYCASSALYDGFVQREPSQVVDEIKELYRIGVRDYAFYDDALLVNAGSHLEVVLKEVNRSGMNIRFHCPNGIHARFLDDSLAGLMKKSGFTTLRLSLETVDQGRQRATGGKVTSDDLESAVCSLKKHGFTKEHIGVYLMYGLPGQGLNEVREGIKFLKELGVRINLTEFSPIPGTPSWEELKHKGVLTDDIDPLLTNNSVFSCLFSGYDPDEMRRLKHDVKDYNCS